ncbi:hypothetical protein Tco_0204313 [Tanacetum coccineum]
MGMAVRGELEYAKNWLREGYVRKYISRFETLRKSTVASPRSLDHSDNNSKAFVRAAAPSTYILAPRSKILPSETPPPGTPPLLPIPLPTPSPPLLLPFTVCRASVSKTNKRLRANLWICCTLYDRISEDPEIKDTDEIYERLDYARDDRSLMSGQLNMLCKDRRAHARTARLMESEAKLSREASTQVTALQSQQGPASDPTRPKTPEQAGSSS